MARSMGHGVARRIRRVRNHRALPFDHGLLLDVRMPSVGNIAPISTEPSCRRCSVRGGWHPDPDGARGREHRPIQVRQVLADVRRILGPVRTEPRPIQLVRVGVAFPTLRPPRLVFFWGTGAVDEAWKTRGRCALFWVDGIGIAGDSGDGTSPYSFAAESPPKRTSTVGAPVRQGHGGWRTTFNRAAGTRRLHVLGDVAQAERCVRIVCPVSATRYTLDPRAYRRAI